MKKSGYLKLSMWYKKYLNAVWKLSCAHARSTLLLKGIYSSDFFLFYPSTIANREHIFFLFYLGAFNIDGLTNLLKDMLSLSRYGH